MQLSDKDKHKASYRQLELHERISQGIPHAAAVWKPKKKLQNIAPSTNGQIDKPWATKRPAQLRRPLVAPYVSLGHS